MPAKPIILSLTSIPPRFKYLPRQLSQLANQTVKPQKIELNLARSYRRFPGELPSLPELPEGVDVYWQDEDLGPATKLLPTAQRYRGKPVDIIAFDDDRRHGKQWVQGFAYSRREHPEAAICGSGFNIDQHYQIERNSPTEPRGQKIIQDSQLHAIHKTNLILEALTLNLRNGEWAQTSKPGYVDVLEGFRGYMLSPDDLPPEAWDIPGDLWKVDDIWISGMLAKNNKKIWLYDMPINRFVDRAIDRLGGLKTIKDAGSTRKELDKKCIHYLRDTYGIWQ